ncbi:MAG: hypothetical protein M3R46_15535 [Actinomycetota bacterium]|nr:hypothetical protein [Actinomycetota bacterium]
MQNNPNDAGEQPASSAPPSNDGIEAAVKAVEGLGFDAKAVGPVIAAIRALGASAPAPTPPQNMGQAADSVGNAMNKGGESNGR